MVLLGKMVMYLKTKKYLNLGREDWSKVSVQFR